MTGFNDFFFSLGNFILLLKQHISYFPLVAVSLSFFLSFLLSEIDLNRLRKKNGSLPTVTFLKEPSTWIFKVGLTSLGSYAFMQLLRWLPESIQQSYLGFIVAAAALLAIGIVADPAKRLLDVKVKGATDPETLGVTAAWYNQWWAWRRNTFQPGAFYNSFFLFPAYYFFSAIALGLVVLMMFSVIEGKMDESSLESLYNAVRSGNIYVMLTGIGMIFNLVYYPSLYPGLYGKSVVRLYALIFGFCAFCGFYSELLLLERISPALPESGGTEPLFSQFSAKVAFSFLTLAGIVFNEAVKNLIKKTVDYVYALFLRRKS